MNLTLLVWLSCWYGALLGYFVPYDILQPSLPQVRNDQWMRVSYTVNFEDENMLEVQFPQNMDCYLLCHCFLCIYICKNIPCQKCLSWKVFPERMSKSWSSGRSDFRQVIITSRKIVLILTVDVRIRWSWDLCWRSVHSG